MKKYDILKNFVLGGCIGVTLMELSSFIVNLFLGKIDAETIGLIKSFLTIFFFGGIIFTLAIISIRSLKYKDLKSKDKQKVLTKQIVLLSIVIIICSGVLLFYALYGNALGVILSLSFIIVFILWAYGCYVEQAILKKNMVMINKV